MGFGKRAERYQQLGNNMELVCYTHSDYKFVWPYWEGQMEKYLLNLDWTVITDRSEDTDFKEYDKFYYEDGLGYKNRLLTTLGQMDPSLVILFSHEDMFLMGEPDMWKLREFEKLVEDDKADCIKLIRAEDHLVKSDLHPNLYENPPHLKFAIQPTIIKVKTLMNILEQAKGVTIWELESSMFVTTAISDKRTFFCYNGEEKRGSSHYDSSIYPYIATAVVKGEWNLAEYKKELKVLFQEYAGA